MLSWTFVLVVASVFSSLGLAQGPGAAGAKPDPLDRENPRSTVTGFLESCRNQDYQKAAQYLDLRRLSQPLERGPGLARQLEQILNSAAHFSVLSLNRDPVGDLSDDSDADRERVASIVRDGRSYTLEMERISSPPGGPRIWLFSADTVAAIPQLTPSATVPFAVRRLPRFMVAWAFLETPLWKWLALILAALLLLSLARQLDRPLGVIAQLAARRLLSAAGWRRLRPLLDRRA